MPKKKRTTKKSTKSKKTNSPTSTAQLSQALSHTKPLAKSTQSKMMTLTQLSVMFVSFLVANSVVVYLANKFFPMAVVLGTHLLSPFTALIQSMLLFTLLIVAVMPVVEIAIAALELKVKDLHWMILYFLINSAGLWVTARFAEMMGLGLSSWVVVLILAFVINAAQGVTFKLVVKNA